MEDLQSNDTNFPSKKSKRMTQKGRLLRGGESHQHIEFVFNSIGDEEYENRDLRSKTPTPVKAIIEKRKMIMI